MLKIIFKAKIYDKLKLIKPNTLVVFALFILGSFILAVRQAVQNTDLWYHLLIGKYIFDFGKIPNRALFILGFDDKLYVYHEWLTQLTMYINYRFFGEMGIRIVRSLISALFFLLALKVIRLKTTRLLTSILLFPVLYYLIRAFITDRPHLLSLVLFTLLIYLVNKYLEEGKKKYLVIIVLLNILYANVHAEWLMGGLLLASLITGVFLDKGWSLAVRDLGITILAFSFTGLLTPFGWRVFIQAGTIMNVTKYMAEWSHVEWPRDSGFLILLGIVIIVKLINFIREKRKSFTEWLPVLVFSLLALNVGRYMIFAIPLLLFTFAGDLEEILQKVKPISLNRVTAYTLVLVMFSLSLVSIFLEPTFDPSNQVPPKELVEQIPHGQKEVLFTHYEFTDYIFFQYDHDKWDSNLKALQDIRGELVTQERWEETIALECKVTTNALRILDKEHIDIILIRENSGLLPGLIGNAKFETVDYKDGFYLFKRRL